MLNLGHHIIINQDVWDRNCLLRSHQKFIQRLNVVRPQDLSLSVCHFASEVIATKGCPASRWSALSEGSVPSLPTSVTLVRTRVLVAREGTAGMCLQPPAVADVCACTASSLSPCWPSTLHTAEPACSALRADVKQPSGAGNCVSEKKGLENRVVFWLWLT